MELMHYGIKQRSGRYPYGSGEQPYQRLSAMERKGVKKKKELSKEILGRELTTKEAVQNKSDMGGISLRRGDKVQHITGIDFGKVREGQLYVTATKEDNALYEAFLSMNLKSKGWNPSKVSLELKEDLNVPSSKQQYNIFKETLKENKKQIISDLNDWLESKKKDISVVKDAENDEKKLYDLFMNSVEKASYSQKLFYDKLKKAGFNGVLDEHDITGSWMQGQKPLIIMDTLATVGNIEITPVTAKEMTKALDEWINSK